MSVHWTTRAGDSPDYAVAEARLDDDQIARLMHGHGARRRRPRCRGRRTGRALGRGDGILGRTERLCAGRSRSRRSGRGELADRELPGFPAVSPVTTSPSI